MEQERKLSATWVINVSFKLIKLIGKKRRTNTEEDIYTAQDIWQQLTTDIYSKTKKGNFVFNYKLKKYEHLSETPMRCEFYRLQNLKERWHKYDFQ